MTRLIASILSAGLIAGLARGEGPSASEGALGLAREPLRRLVVPVLQDGRLVLDRSGWPTERFDTRGLTDMADETDLAGKRKTFAEEMNIPEDAIPDHVLAGDESGPSTPLPLIAEVMRLGGGRTHGGGGSGGTLIRRDWEGEDLSTSMSVDTVSGGLRVRFVEHGGSRRTLEIEDGPGQGVSLRLDDPGAGRSVFFTTAPDGRVSLVGRTEEGAYALTEPDFASLLWASPEEASSRLLRPLAELGILVAPDGSLPEVIAAATSGFGPAEQNTAKDVDRWIAALSADEFSLRKDASLALARLYPLAVRRVREAVEASTDPEARARLRLVIDARPDIEAALAWVQSTGLHEDRTYLLEVLGRSRTYRAAARARLAELYGADHGDDPSAWPAPK